MPIKISNQRYEEIKRIVVRMFVKYGVSCVPINGFEIAHKMGIKVIPYSAIAPSKRWPLIKKSEDGFSVEMDNGQWYIFYNDEKDYGRVNHTIMHELGHIVLDHTEDSELAEKEVKFFAKYALAPPVLVKKQALDVDNLALIACSDTKSNDSSVNTQKGVHFFVDDYRFNGIYNNPEKTLAKYAQYAFLLTPDFSTYADMNLWRQMESVAKNRWCGAYWQSKGLKVVPTISWSTPSSYDFCFDGVEKNAIVAIGMIGCKHDRLNFMRGYYAMLERIHPETIICFGTPFPEMKGNIVTVDYSTSRKVVR